MRCLSIFKLFVRRETGVTLLETLVALAILGTVAVAFLAGLTTTSAVAFSVDERATALSLAQSQMEWIQSSNYTIDAAWYSAAPIPEGRDYTDFSVNITSQPLHNPDDGIQKITVIVNRSTENIMTLEGYKVNR